MPNEWFVEVDGKAIGPFTVKQLKAQATAGRIHGETKVRRGAKGKWYLAKNVKGLLATATSTESSGSSQPTDNQAAGARKRKGDQATSPAVAASGTTAGTFLAPVRTRKIRAIVFGCLVALVMIGTTPIWQKLIFAFTMALLIGSYPLVEVKKKTIIQTLIIAFYPVHVKKWKLRDFVSVMPSTEPRITDTIGCLVLFFFWYWFLFRLFDHLIPWMGGNYKLSLKQHDFEKLVIWQGNNATDFEANLALFESKGLPIE